MYPPPFISTRSRPPTFIPSFNLCEAYLGICTSCPRAPFARTQSCVLKRADNGKKCTYFFTHIRISKGEVKILIKMIYS